MNESAPPPGDVFHSLFMTSPEMLLVASKGGEIAYANEALVRALGPIAERAKLVDLAHPEDRDVLAAGLERLGLGEARVELTCRFAGADGSPSAFTCSLWTAPSRGEVYGGLRPAAADEPAPSEAPKSEAARRAADLLGRGTPGLTHAKILRAILDNLPIVVWVLNSSGEYLVSEGKGLEVVGLTPGLVVGRRITEFSPEVLEPGMPISRTFTGEVVVETSHHVGRWWTNWTAPVRDESGGVAFVAGISLDVTDSKVAEQELLAKLELIERQQEVIRELGVPIIEVWDGVVALPMSGVIDTRRASEMMDGLLEAISRRGARHAILDLTGVSMVDSAVASHLVSLTRAVQLLGAEGIVTGIRSSVAQTMVALGLNLQEVTTLSNLREGIRYCILRSRGRAADQKRDHPVNPATKV